MLWVYINNQGVAECVVNVGNKIRQGDAIDMFVCLEGMQDGAAIYELNRISYLKPGAKEFVLTDVTIGSIASKTFVLGDPSMANSHFVAPNKYFGYPVSIPSAATEFVGNGGHVAFEVVLLRKSDSQYLHAQTLSVFVEPTYGKFGNNITSEDYSTLVDMLRLSNYNYAAPMVVNSAGGVSLADDDPLHSPVLIVGETNGFVRGKVNVDTESIGNDEYVEICHTTIASLDLAVESLFVGSDASGNAVRMKIAEDGNKISVLANRADLANAGGVVVLSYFGMCSVLSLLLDFTSSLEEGVVAITGVTSQSERVAWDYEGELVSVSVVRDLADESKGVLHFIFKIPEGKDGEDGLPALISSVTGSVTTNQYAADITPPASQFSAQVTGPSETNEFDIGMNFVINVNKGHDGIVTDAPGAIGFTTNEDGELLVITADGNNHSLYLVSDDPSSPSYYATLGVSADWVGCIIIADGSGQGSYGTYYLIYEEITYADLKDLRDAGKLVPGQQYRITDYACTTTAENTSSAGHAFDIIVTADTTSSLNETARACLHSGDTYFANNKLSAWELKYCLDNDITRFNWADSANGKGVIYYMKDEYGNEAPYDFKNIKQEVTLEGTTETVYTFCFLLTATTIYMDRPLNYGITQLSYNSGSDTTDYYAWYSSSGAGMTVYTLKTEGMNPTTAYTLHPGTGEYSFAGNVLCVRQQGYTDASSIVSYGMSCYGNKMGKWLDYGNFKFPYITMHCSLQGATYSENIFGDNCHRIHLKSSLMSGNKFAYGCSYITGYGSYYNDISSNSVGMNGYQISFSGNNGSNIIGDYCSYIQFGFENYSIRIGNRCSNIDLGGNYNYITIGNNCSYITFGNPVRVLDYVRNVTIGNDCNYLYIMDMQGRTPISSAYLQNIVVEDGVSGASSSNRSSCSQNIGFGYVVHFSTPAATSSTTIDGEVNGQIEIEFSANGTVSDEDTKILLNEYPQAVVIKGTGQNTDVWRNKVFYFVGKDEARVKRIWQTPVYTTAGGAYVYQIAYTPGTYDIVFSSITL